MLGILNEKIVPARSNTKKGFINTKQNQYKEAVYKFKVAVSNTKKLYQIQRSSIKYI